MTPTFPLYDPDTQTVTEIPARELAEGCASGVGVFRAWRG